MKTILWIEIGILFFSPNWKVIGICSIGLGALLLLFWILEFLHSMWWLFERKKAKRSRKKYTQRELEQIKAELNMEAHRKQLLREKGKLIEVPSKKKSINTVEYASRRIGRNMTD